MSEQWEVREGGNYVYVGKAGYSAQCDHTHYLGGDLAIAKMFYPVGATIEQHNEAVRLAHLIAAAPDLLQVLKAIMRDLPAKRDWLDPITEKFANETIAAAENRATIQSAGGGK